MFVKKGKIQLYCSVCPTTIILGTKYVVSWQAELIKQNILRPPNKYDQWHYLYLIQMTCDRCHNLGMVLENYTSPGLFDYIMSVLKIIKNKPMNNIQKQTSNKILSTITKIITQ